MNPDSASASDVRTQRPLPGLSQREAEERLRKVGPNDPAPPSSGNPLRSRPSGWLTLNTLAIVAVGLALPWSPLAKLLGFTPLPGPYFLFLAASIVTYLLLVEVAKSYFFRRTANIQANPVEVAS